VEDPGEMKPPNALKPLSGWAVFSSDRKRSKTSSPEGDLCDGDAAKTRILYVCPMPNKHHLLLICKIQPY
jgi:hypothetical protein